MSFIEDALEEPGFWILAGLGLSAELIGYIISKKSELGAFPLWQLIVVMVGTIFASAYFATKD